jgi:hypothetical protein
MVRIGIAIAALMAAAGTWANPVTFQPEPSRHEKFGLQITFPAKWIVGTGDEPLLLLSRSTDPVSLANCVATGEQIEGTRPLSQAQINEGLSKPFGEEFWRQIYAASGLVAEIKSQSARTHNSGLTIQEAYFDLSKSGSAEGSKMSVQQAIFVRPGYTVTVACSSRAAAYPAQKKALAAVIDSVDFFAPAATVADAGAAVVPVSTGAFDTPTAMKSAGPVAPAGATLLNLSN